MPRNKTKESPPLHPIPDGFSTLEDVRDYLRKGVEAAEKLKYTIDDYAAAIGISPKWLRDILSGRGNPGPKTISGLTGEDGNRHGGIGGVIVKHVRRRDWDGPINRGRNGRG